MCPFSTNGSTMQYPKCDGLSALLIVLEIAVIKDIAQTIKLNYSTILMS